MLKVNGMQASAFRASLQTESFVLIKILEFLWDLIVQILYEKMKTETVLSELQL